MSAFGKKAAAYYRDAAIREREEARQLRARAAEAPEERRGVPTTRFPEGYVSHPRANITAAAESAERRAVGFDELADRLDPR